MRPAWTARDDIVAIAAIRRRWSTLITVEQRDSAVIAVAKVRSNAVSSASLYEVVASNREPRSILPKRIL